jgi:hypothetical protein
VKPYLSPATVAMFYVIVSSMIVSSMGGTEMKESLMRYKAKSIAALQLALGGLPDKMRVEVEPDEVSAKTVGELRKLTAWPETLAVTTPRERQADSVVKVSKVSVATRTAPKTFRLRPSILPLIWCATQAG